MEVSVFVASDKHLPKCLQLWNLCGYTDGKSKLIEELAERLSSQKLWVAVDHEQVIGTLAWRCRPSRHVMLLHHLAVHPSFRRRGIGKILLAKAIEYAREQKFKRVIANVQADNEVANKIAIEIFNFTVYKTSQKSSLTEFTVFSLRLK